MCNFVLWKLEYFIGICSEPKHLGVVSESVERSFQIALFRDIFFCLAHCFDLFIVLYFNSIDDISAYKICIIKLDSTQWSYKPKVEARKTLSKKMNKNV